MILKKTTGAISPVEIHPLHFQYSIPQLRPPDPGVAAMTSLAENEAQSAGLKPILAPFRKPAKVTLTDCTHESSARG